MREADPISEMRRALRQQGVWGTRAERLLQDWSEHVRETAAQRIADGAAPEAASEAAWQTLGTPQILAAQAARELTQGSWMGRHPWLAGLGLPLAGWLLCMAMAVLVAMTMLAPGVVPRPGALTTLETAVDWVPWLLGSAWLAWLVRRMPGGWKLYWISVVVLVLLSTSMICQIKPPTHGPGTRASGPRLGLVMTLGGIPGAILNKLGGVFHLWERLKESPNEKTVYFSSPSTVVPWIQIALSTVGMIGVHRWSRSSSGPDRPRPA